MRIFGAFSSVSLALCLTMPRLVVPWTCDAAESWAYAYPGVAPRAKSVEQTADGGYIVGGSAYGTGQGGHDLWIMKLDNTGDIIWQNTYGGPGYDFPEAVIGTTDGGYVIAGYTQSFGAGAYDAWVIRLDEDGNIVWQNTLGGIYNDKASCIIQTYEGGFMMAGYAGHYSPNQHPDLWLVKLDPSGNVMWERTYGGGWNEYANAIQQTLDGGFVIAGHTETFGPNLRYDFWLLKIDSIGNVLWQKVLGLGGHDVPYSIQITSDGGIIVAGYLGSIGANEDHMWVVKLDMDGDIAWQKAYGTDRGEQAYSISEVTTGGYILGGITGHPGAGEKDALALRLDPEGNILWQKVYKGSAGYWRSTVKETVDGGFIAVGVDTSLTIYKLDEDGDIPGCDLVDDYDAVMTVTSVPSVDTNVVAKSVVSITSPTHVSPQSTSVMQTVLCEPPCWDNDGDGYGNPASPSCPYPEWDCDDTNPDINPGAKEICNDGIDNNCSGFVDCEDPECEDEPACNWRPARTIGQHRSSDCSKSLLVNYLGLSFGLPLVGFLVLRRVYRRGRVDCQGLSPTICVSSAGVLRGLFQRNSKSR